MHVGANRNDDKMSNDEKVLCPHCRRNRETRLVPVEPGYGEQLDKYVCDDYGIGFYVSRGQTDPGNIFTQSSAETLVQALERAKKAYLPHKNEKVKEGQNEIE